MQLVRAGWRTYVIPLLNRICTQQHEAHHVGKNWVHTPSCVCRTKMAEADADAIVRTAEVVTAERCMKPCKAWCISWNVYVQLLLQVS